MEVMTGMGIATTLTALGVILSPVLKVLFILIVGLIVIKVVTKVLGKAFEKTKFDPSLIRFVLKAARIIMWIFVALSALDAIGVATTGIVAAMSAAAVGVAVALKDSLNNVAGGIILLFAPRFATGDYIAAGGDEGTVLAVDLLHTTIKTVDNKQVSIPNGLLLNSHIINYSHEPKRRVDITFTISYDADVEIAKKAALEVIKAHPYTMNDPAEPFVRIGGYGDSAVDLVTRTWTTNEHYWDLYFDLMEQIRVALDENNIEIPYNQLDVRIKNN
ncbi:MAG: mechanosensitive ion channel [Firmicutes bacterium]|nr:mechanosensitive ion channel [Bacillota bacterium]